MSLIQPLSMNMHITRNVYEGSWENPLIRLMQKVAVYTLVPLALIAMFEAFVKNLLIINTLNVAIVLINKTYDLLKYIPNCCFQKKDAC